MREKERNTAQIVSEKRRNGGCARNPKLEKMLAERSASIANQRASILGEARGGNELERGKKESRAGDYPRNWNLLASADKRDGRGKFGFRKIRNS